MNQHLYGIWLGDVFFSFSGEISEVKVDAWMGSMRRLQTAGGERPFKQAALRLAELRWPSPVRELSRRSDKKGMTGRSLEGLALSPAEAWSLLTGLEEADLEAQGIMPGGEMLYWREAARFALDLLSRGKIVPGTRPALTSGRRRSSTSAVRGVWCPLLEDEGDEQRFRLLAASMPPLGIAPLKIAGEEEELQSVEERQIAVLHSFLTAMMDSKVQEAVALLEKELRRLRAEYRRGTSPLGELWWNQLTGSARETEVQGNSAEIEELVHAAAAIGGEPPKANDDGVQEQAPGIGLCLRLEPPANWEEQPFWTLTVWAENSEEGLLVPADTVWNLPGEDLKTGGRVYPDARKKLLLSLYRAAEHSAEIREAMNNPRPEGTELRQEEVFRFLTRSVPQLRKHGVTVQMPSKWTKEGKRRAGIKLKLGDWEERGAHRAEASREAGLGMQHLLSFRLEAMLGDKALTEQELTELAASKTPFVLFEGEWVEIDVKEIRQVLKYIKKHEQASMTFGELMQLASIPEFSGEWEGLNIAGFEMEGMLEALVHGESELFGKKSRIPGALQGTLRPYQERGFQWLSLMRRLGFGALLADDMGLGKTIQVITAMLDSKEARAETENGEHAADLIICPTSLLGNWQRELNRFAPELSVYIHHGSKRLHGEDFKEVCREHDVVLTTYQLVGRDVAEMRGQPWAAIVLDEAQYIKNFGTKQAQSVMKLEAPQRIAMTGTPVENRLGELWSIFQFLNPGYLGSAAAFRRQYAQGADIRPQDLAKLRKLVAPFLLRRLKSDPDISKDLPSKIEMKSYCGLSAEQAQLYRRVTDELLGKIDGSRGIARKGLVLSSLTRLKQICDHPALQTGRSPRGEGTGRSGKLERLLELTDTMTENGEAALIFTQYVRMGELLAAQFAVRYGFNPYFLHGSVHKKERDEMVRAFQEGSGPPIFILSLKAGGVGLNLTRANHVIHYDRWWNPAVENQATDRVFRIGQEKNVEVHKLICQGTLEERIDDLIERKKLLSEQVVGSGENWLTEMSTQELQELITLQAEEWSQV